MMRNSLLAMFGLGAAVVAVGGNVRAQAGVPRGVPETAAVAIKLEWVTNAPRATEQLTVVVDDEEEATVREAGRTVQVKPSVNPDGTILLRLKVTGLANDVLDTAFTVPKEETRVVQAITRKNGRDVKERLLFVTVTPVRE
jgi:hypothetical protein